jgi:pyruvate kinase
MLLNEIEKRTGDKEPIPVIIKIETLASVRILPEILVAAASRAPIAVMIARGDLAVEVGYTRLSEYQEEILWICEAAHVPVIWATQVLETLVKTGIPTRAEISDVTLGAKSECIMLNKGEHVDDAVVFVDDVLSKFEKHVYKKTAILRKLTIASDLFS